VKEPDCSPPVQLGNGLDRSVAVVGDGLSPPVSLPAGSRRLAACSMPPFHRVHRLAVPVAPPGSGAAIMRRQCGHGQPRVVRDRSEDPEGSTVSDRFRVPLGNLAEASCVIVRALARKNRLSHWAIAGMALASWSTTAGVAPRRTELPQGRPTGCFLAARRVSAPMPTPDHRRLCSSSGTERCSAPTCCVVAGWLRAGFRQTTR